MKNNRHTPEIKPEDFDSPLMWKAFWKTIRQETFLGFLLKVILVAAGFITLMFFIVLLGMFSGS